ncbi:hypothetical protein FVE85_1634 [Porphyridium purpureum]|uniref:SGNH hydrolase-type esterase domain-containing protein n=1 Tax=Porphyridium purpureum TaxID=35688 RepID=A0A5J4YVF3_PORPP|nr:hypothetical protein FVE85_1634 [Porphyridium purpureum]|eukprot:POR2212..scf209_3
MPARAVDCERLAMRLRKVLLASGAALGLVAIGQAAYLQYTYESPPECEGPRVGTALGERAHLFVEKLEMLKAQDIHDFRMRTQELQRSTRQRMEGLLSEARSRLVAMNPHHHSSASAVFRSASDTDRTWTQHPTDRVVLLIGDSLVTGVGCCCDDEALKQACEGPALARGLAKSLAEQLHEPLQWHALGLTGGGVRELEEHILPCLDELSASVRQRVCAVVIVCGVNDWKRAWRFWEKKRIDPAEFGKGLESLICGVRAKLGLHDVHIFLPAVQAGVYFAPRFPFILRKVLSYVSRIWDDEKRDVSRTMKNVTYIEAGLENYQDMDRDEHVKYYSKMDGIHPNSAGYERWAEYIATKMVESRTLAI